MCSTQESLKNKTQLPCSNNSVPRHEHSKKQKVHFASAHLPPHDAQNSSCHPDMLSGNTTSPEQQLLTQLPGVSDPSMKNGFALHSAPQGTRQRRRKQIQKKEKHNQIVKQGRARVLWFTNRIKTNTGLREGDKTARYRTLPYPTPLLAQLAHSPLSSTHFGFFHTPVANLRSWIHFVAVHLVPPATRVVSKRHAAATTMTMRNDGRASCSLTPVPPSFSSCWSVAHQEVVKGNVKLLSPSGETH